MKNSSSPADGANTGILLRSMRWIYRRLPLGQDTKAFFAHTLFAAFPLLFQHTPAYRYWSENRKPGKETVRNWAGRNRPVLEATESAARELCFEPVDRPEVSIIIPVYGKADYTLHCLQAIQESRGLTTYEVIVVDDCSRDNTGSLLALIQGLRVITNESNIGFLHSCNKGAGEARGRYLLFLNNDTQVHPEWLDALYSTFREHPGAGLVGSKFIYPDGTLQEAGGMIWRDAGGANYGRGDDPVKPEYSYLRDVDYCSGASIMIPRELFRRLGGFDTRFAPAYYEDTDLAFSVRQAGYRVLFQPASLVIHFEGITSGTDISTGVKSFQRINKERMHEKWRDTLLGHPAGDEPLWVIKDRLAQKRVLLVDVITPRPDQDSGSIDTRQYIKMLQAMGFKVVFFSYHLLYEGRYTEALQCSGVECLYQPYVRSLKKHLELCGPYYDLVILQRLHQASRFIEPVRRYCRNAKIIFNTVDLHFLREQRQADIRQSARLLKQARRTKALELSVMKRADATIVISETEKALVQQELAQVKVAAIPYIREAQGSGNPFGQRRDILFIGGFLHEPNVDAMQYFVADIWPLVRNALPEARLLIVGSNMPDAVKSLAREAGVEVLGFVEDLKPVLDRCRLTIAPLRYGAGIKGKIGTSISHGVPCVATPIAAEGMALAHGKSVMIGTSAESFAASVIELYEDEVLWNKLSANGLDIFQRHYSFARGLERFRALLNEVFEADPAIEVPEAAKTAARV